MNKKTGSKVEAPKKIPSMFLKSDVAKLGSRLRGSRMKKKTLLLVFFFPSSSSSSSSFFGSLFQVVDRVVTFLQGYWTLKFRMK